MPYRTSPYHTTLNHIMRYHSIPFLPCQVENFPGFPAGITGPDLMSNMRDQGERWGAVFETEDVESVDFSTRPFVVRSTSRVVKAHTVIIATGE